VAFENGKSNDIQRLGLVRAMRHQEDQLYVPGPALSLKYRGVMARQAVQDQDSVAVVAERPMELRHGGKEDHHRPEFEQFAGHEGILL
jgi:hypothetical protein